MLSKATNNPNEAISLAESSDLARGSGIRNVVFISDACRSTPDSLGIGRVRGNLIFPVPQGSVNIDPDVDHFFATHPGDPALELPVGTSVQLYEGIYTSCFLAAFEHPDDSMVRTVNGMRVVPNNKLKDYLVREVRKKTEAKSIRLRQIPDTRVLSGDTTYIGRAVGASSSESRKAEQTFFDTARDELTHALAGTPSFVVHDDEYASLKNTKFTAAQLSIRNAAIGADGFQIQTGLNVVGAFLDSVEVGAKFEDSLMRFEFFGQDITHGARVNLGAARARNVALRFKDGSGTVVAVLAGYISNVVVADGGVINVSYIPTRTNERWPEFERQRDYISRLRAVVAASARIGTFRIEGDKESRTHSAEQLTNSIRIAKGIDPTLGLYAAYAFAEANLLGRVQLVRDAIRNDLKVDMFDVALLADGLLGRRSSEIETLYPFCPMLSRGWGLLRVKDVRLPFEIEAVKDHLRAALWTTFEPAGMDIIIGGLRSGKLL